MFFQMGMTLMNSYKYWFYYWDNELYAYTDKKEYAKGFESFRNMKKFKRIKKYISKSEVNQLASDEMLRYLVTMPFTIYNKNNGEVYEDEYIVTQIEKMTVNNYVIKLMNQDLFNYAWICNPYIFKKPIFKALKFLCYNDAYNVVSASSKTGYYSFEDDSKIKLKPDELGIFLHIYWKTVRGDQ